MDATKMGYRPYGRYKDGRYKSGATNKSMDQLKNYSIAVVSLTYPPYLGGAERQMSLLVEELIKHKINLTVYTIGHPDRGKKPYIKDTFKLGRKINFCDKLVWFILLFFQLQLLKKNTVIYSFGYGFDKFIIYLVHILKKIPFIIKFPGTLDENLFRRYQAQIKKLPERLQYKIILNANFIIVQDNISVKNFLMKLKVDRNRIAVIKNGVKINQYKKIDKIKKILFVGRIIAEKGINELLRAFIEISSEIEDLELKVIGDGPDLPAIMKQFERMRNGRVIFAGKINKVEKYYQDADLFVFPTYREGLPNVVLEAMSFGLPVISTPVGALPEIFTDYKEIIYVKPKDVVDLQNKMKELILNPALAVQIGYLAYQKVNEEFSIEKNCQEHIQLFDKTMSTQESSVRFQPDESSVQF
ncbi:MAG: glycosyltransferase family 4 protein [Elusimicrobiota bacterium]